MTREEAIKMAKAKLECIERQTSGKAELCNDDCESCSLCYEQGNMGEQKEWLKMAIKSLEQDSCEDATVKKLCATCKYEHKRPEENPCRNCERLNKWESDNTVEDAISRADVIDACNQSVNILEATDRIKDLPPVVLQEPFMNKPCVARQVCHEDKAKILDKIRAEINEQYDRVHPYNLSCAEGLEMALGIIEKYNAESEKKEEISKDDAIKIVHDTIHDFFVDSETFNDKDKLLLKINKAICNNIMGY